MEKQWKILHSESCPNCGDHLEVLSENSEENDTEYAVYLTDGDEVRCMVKCGFESCMSVDDETGDAWVQDGNLNELYVTD